MVSNGYFRRIRMLASGGAGSFVVDEQRAENQAITRTLSYTPFVRAAGSQHKEVALTFDDGPGPYTPDILRVLVREHVPATFFEVGIEERYFHAATAEIVARGYPIGDHTESHQPMSQLKRKAQLAPAAPGLRRDRQLRRAVPADVPAALRAVEPHHPVAAAQVQDADGALVSGHRRLRAARRQA